MSLVSDSILNWSRSSSDASPQDSLEDIHFRSPTSQKRVIGGGLYWLATRTSYSTLSNLFGITKFSVFAPSSKSFAGLCTMFQTTSRRSPLGGRKSYMNSDMGHMAVQTEVAFQKIISLLVLELHK